MLYTRHLHLLNVLKMTGPWWLMPVILWRKRSGESQIEASPRQIVWRLCLEKTQHKKKAGGVAQMILV
jgi:hypothetical protein